MSGLSDEEANSLAVEWVGHIQRDLLISNEQCIPNCVSTFGTDMMGLQTTTEQNIPMGFDVDLKSDEIDDILFSDHCTSTESKLMLVNDSYAEEMGLVSASSGSLNISSEDYASNSDVVLTEHTRLVKQSAPQDIPSRCRSKSKLNPFSAVFTPSPRQVWQENIEEKKNGYHSLSASSGLSVDCLTCGNSNSISTNWCDNCGTAFCRDKDKSIYSNLNEFNMVCPATYPPTFEPISPQQHHNSCRQHTGSFFSNDCVMLTDELRNLTISSVIPIEPSNQYWSQLQNTNIQSSCRPVLPHHGDWTKNCPSSMPNHVSMWNPSNHQRQSHQLKKNHHRKRSKKSNKRRCCSLKTKPSREFDNENNCNTEINQPDSRNLLVKRAKSFSFPGVSKVTQNYTLDEFQDPDQQMLHAGLALPDEILFYIFSYLTPVDLAKCCLVCRQFNSLASCDALWKSKPLHLKKCKVNDGILRKAAKKAPSSFSLTYCDCKSVTESGVSQFFKACGTNLKEFSVGNCNNSLLPNVPILTSMLPHSQHLISVDLSWCTIDESGIRDLADTIKRLEILRLSGCQEMSDATIQHICQKHGDSLRVLELFGCFKLSNSSMYHVAENCRRLQTLKIGQCYKVCESGLDHIVWKSVGLQELDLRGVKKLVDNAVKKIAMNLSMLSTLVLANCPLISDASVLAVAEKMHLIRVLDVCGCCRITDKSLHELASSCPMIEALDVSSTKVTSSSVSALARGPCKKLNSLKLSFCSRITLTSLTELVTQCKSLQLLHLFGCKGVRNTTQLNQINPLLEVQQ